MRNLKKFLALALAMVMAFSLMLSASAASVKYSDYKDSEDITPAFNEAVQVLTGLEVLRGDDSSGTVLFRPNDTITRAEAAAIIYRVVTGDVSDRQVELYSDYGTFTDVNKGDWFAGYVGYCQNAGYIKGTTPTTFSPYAKVTGYEALAMILRAVGYGKNNEFTGTTWQVNVAALARQLGVTRNVTGAHMENTLTMAAPREVVADLIFMTIATVPTVTYTPALAYNDKQNVTSQVYNSTLGQEVFGLFHDTEWQVVDEWGNPGYRWRDNGKWYGRVTTVAGGKGYMAPANHPWYEETSDTSTVATIKQAPDYETTHLIRECDVAEAVKFETSADFKLFVNGKNSVTHDYRVVATDTVTKVGGEGRLTKVYYKMENPWFTDDVNNHDKVVTMVDTMLARVNSKTNAVLDPAGHVITPAKMEVTIWDGALKTNVATTAIQSSSERTISKPATSKDNWDDYNKGDYILIHAYTVANTDAARATQADKEEAAFETDKVIDNTTHTLTQGTNVWIAKNDNKGLAPSIQGKQTVTYWNQGKHQVDNKDYLDQLCLFLDRAGSNTNTTFTWFFDLYGNIIGIGDAKSTNFGVITAIYSAFVQGEGDTTGAVKAIATVKYADGTTGTVQIDRFLMSTNETSATGWTVTPGTGIKTVVDTQLEDGDNTVDLRPLYDTTSHAAMTPGSADPSFNTSDAEFPGYIYIAPSTVSNTYAHFEDDTQDVYGILYDHMFEFTTANDNAVVAIEVAGNGSNENLYVNKQNADVNSTNVGMIYKSLGFLTLNAGATTEAGITGNAGDADVWLDNDTQIIVRTGTGMNDTKLKTYNGVSALPGNVVLDIESEVDWADTDGDGRADYLYVTGSSTGTITYGLFYYNGTAAQWNGTTGTIAGYLNGKSATLTFDDYDNFKAINNSQGYDGHLFAVQITDDVVSLVLGNADNTDTAWTENILMEIDGTAQNVSGFKVDDFATNLTGDTTPTFVVGTQGGNTYSATTEAVYYLDNRIDTNDVNNFTNLSYVSENRGNKIVVKQDGQADVEYWLAPNCDIIGELVWLNLRQCDVTIVYENGSALSATQVYITPDPDVTPSEYPDGPSGAEETEVGGANAVTMPEAANESDSQDNLANLIETGMRDTVIYNPQAANPTDLSGLASSASPTNLLYFPYSAPDGTYTLMIKNPAGTVVYREAASVTENGLNGTDSGLAHCFVIDITGRTNTGVGGALSKGVTYSFQIVSASGDVVSDGSFDIG